MINPIEEAARDKTAGKGDPLRDDIRLLGRLTVETVRAQEGDTTFDAIEQLRQTSLRFHTEEGSAHISGTRDRTGSYMMIYLPEGQPVTVDMIKLSGSSAAGWWFDPRTGAATRLKDSFPTDRQQRFTPPPADAATTGYWYSTMWTRAFRHLVLSVV